MSQSYTVDDIARLLQVSKLTVYDLIKKGDIPAYRVGRQMRVDALDLERYKSRGKGIKIAPEKADASSRPIVISGQDESLDIFARVLESRHSENRPLRSYVGSLDGLIAMYQGEADIVSTHLFDGNTDTYNIPYVQKLLVSKPFVIIKFIKREAGLYVAKGNPKNIKNWQDLSKPSITMANREAGAGARVLLDEQLRIHDIKRSEVNGYENEHTSHLAIASAVASNQVDVGVGIKRAARMADIDFIPLVTECYDLVLLDSAKTKDLITNVQVILKSEQFQDKLTSLGYAIEGIGDIAWRQ